MTSSLAQVYLTCMCADLLGGTASKFDENQLPFLPPGMENLKYLGTLHNNGEIDRESLLDEEIDLVPLVQAAILVDLPLLPLCDEDCRGICQDCGVNLNKVQCGCAEKRARQDAEDAAAANPFAALAQLKFDEE